MNKTIDKIKQTLDRMLCGGLDSSNKVAETFVVKDDEQ